MTIERPRILLACNEEVYERWEPTGEPDVDPELVKEHNF